MTRQDRSLLSSRQRECLRLVQEGMTSKQIGRLLMISPSTVDNHVKLAIERLGAVDRAAAAALLNEIEQVESTATPPQPIVSPETGNSDTIPVAIIVMNATARHLNQIVDTLTTSIPVDKSILE